MFNTIEGFLCGAFIDVIAETIHPAIPILFELFELCLLAFLSLIMASDRHWMLPVRFEAIVQK